MNQAALETQLVLCPLRYLSYQLLQMVLAGLDFLVVQHRLDFQLGLASLENLEVLDLLWDQENQGHLVFRHHLQDLVVLDCLLDQGNQYHQMDREILVHLVLPVDHLAQNFLLILEHPEVLWCLEIQVFQKVHVGQEHLQVQHLLAVRESQAGLVVPENLEDLDHLVVLVYQVTQVFQDLL